MVFSCAQCGSCCMYLGDYIQIEEKTGPYQFSCSCVSTGTPFLAVVDEDKRNIFDNPEFSQQNPHACSFLRPAGDGRVICTIHETSPAQCKIYRCVILKITRPGSGQIGYITGTGALHSDDKELREIYEKGLSSIPPSCRDREEWIAAYLTEQGYQVQ